MRLFAGWGYLFVLDVSATALEASGSMRVVAAFFLAQELIRVLALTGCSSLALSVPGRTCM